MKVSDTAISKTNHERRPMKKNTGNGISSSNQQVPNSQSVKVERTLKVKNGQQSEAQTERKSSESSRKLRRSDKPPEKEIKETSRSSPPVKKPWIPCTRRPSKPKLPPPLIKMELSLVDPNKVCKKFSTSPTSDSSDTEKSKKNQNAKVPRNNNGQQKSQLPSSIIPTTTDSVCANTTESKRSKVTLKRQLALDNAPSNLNKSFSISDESLNSITSVTQLLKIERSFAFTGSSNNSNSACDDEAEEEDFVTGGVKSLAARWQARNDKNADTANTNQNGILRKNKNNDSILSNKVSEEESKTLRLRQAIKQNGLNKDAAVNANQAEEQEKYRTTNKSVETKPVQSAAVSSTFGRNVSSSTRKSPQPQENSRKNAGKSPHTRATISETSSSALLKAAAAITAAPPERKISRTKSSSNSPSSCSSSLLLKGQTGSTVAAKKIEFPVPTTVKKDTSSLNKPEKPRSRSTSPIKSSTVSVTPIVTPKSLLLPLTRGRSTSRRATLVDTTKLFNHDDDHQQQRRSRSVSSTSGLPSYAAATTTSLAKQTNQIRDHKEEPTSTTTTSSNKSTSYHKSHSIKANTSISGTTASTAPVVTAVSTVSPVLTGNSSDARGQGQQRNVVGLKKNRIRDDHSTRKNDSHQIATALLKNANTSIKPSSAAAATTCCSNSSSLSLSSSTTATTPSLSLQASSSSSSSLARNRKINNNTNNNIKGDNRNTLRKLERGSSTTKSDIRGGGGSANKTNFRINDIATGRKREEGNYLTSSYSLPPSSSAAVAAASPAIVRSSSLDKTKQQKRRIIPSIIMSEYVDEDNKDGKTTVLAHTKSLFIPLQLVEPLEPTYDIEEGSCLELKVRVKGAEAVIWVKENKIIPNAPPDFEYFQEKASDLYGLRIADVFHKDSGLYILEAYGAGGSEKICWCQVNVLEAAAGRNVEEDYYYDDEDISWEDLNMSEEIKSPQPLVVPVIVTSQAEQESEPGPPFETAIPKEPSPIRTVAVKQVDSEEEEEKSLKESSHKTHPRNSLAGRDNVDVACDDQITSNKQSSYCHQKQLKKSSLKNESAFPKSFVVAEQITSEDNEKKQGAGIKTSNQRVKSQSSLSSKRQLVTKVVSSKSGEGMAEETVTEFASANITKARPFTYPEEMKSNLATNATTVSVIVPAEADHLAGTAQSDTNQSGHQHNHHQDESGKRKLTSELSSASDESIYLKEQRSGDEGAVSSAEENSTSISLDVKSNVTNDEECTTVTSVDSPFPPLSSPSCSEQNGRSSSVDSAIGFLGRPLFSDGKFPPRILVGPNSIIALYDEVVHLRVKVQNYGIPKTSVNWFKFVNGTYKKIELNSGDQSSSQGEAHLSITKCGTSLSTLTITHVNYDDCGRYRVKVQNLLGMDSHDCLLTVEGPPEAPGTPPKVKYDEKSKTILIQWSSCPYDGGSKITGYYVEASIVQGSKTSINRDDLDNWQLLTPQSYSWLCYTLTNPKRGSVYRFRVFGENNYGKGKPTEPSLPLLVPVLMEGRRAGSSDALLWSIKSLSPEETSLRTDTSRKLVREREIKAASVDNSSSVQEEEEPLEYKNVTVKRESFYNVYDKLDELGKGRFGIVYEVLHKESKKSYAGKFVKCIKAKDKERVQLEVKIMNDLGYHPKLICLIDAFEMPREIVIVTQQINGGELFERVVADDFTLTEGDCITFLRQICDAVRFIHAKNIMHLDLKPENILCCSKNSNVIKIIDFGLAQYYDPKEPIRVLFGTAEFVSPEIINYETIAPSTDNWSIGVITYILLSGLSPFMGDNDNETFSNITRAEFDFEDEAFEKISDDAKDFISTLIVKRPEKRLTAEQCLSHRWLKQESVDCKKGIILSTDKLKRFLVRRKWQKTGNAIRALSRMTTLYSRRSSSASSTTTPTGSMSISSPPPPSPFRSGSLALQESMDDNVFFSHSSTSPENNLNLKNNINRQKINQIQMTEVEEPSVIDTKAITTTSTTRQKFTDPSRSDSGVCDIGSFSSSLNYD